MSDILSQPTPQTDAEYEAVLRQLLTEMNRVEEQINKDRAESERLKIETQSIKAQTEAKLTLLEALMGTLSRAN